MAKIDLKFLCAYSSYDSISCVYNEIENKIHLKSIEGEDNSEIWLDKSTAIKFAKTLRTEINKISSNE